MAKRKDRTRDGQKLGPAYHIKPNPSQTVSLRNENFGIMARRDKKADKNTPLSTPMDHLRKETTTYTQMYSGKGKNKTKTVQSSWNRNGGKSGKSGNQPKPMNRNARIMSATLSDSHKRPAIMATDQAKRELEAENDRNNSPMGALRRRARKAQTGQADNYSREDADKRLFSETLSSARKAEKNYKKAFEENRYTGGSKTLLSGADTKNLSEEDQNDVQVWKDEWDKGQRLIDQGYTQKGKQIQAEAHAQAERIRMAEGYSGGESGSDFTTPEIRQDEYAGMSDSGRKNLRVAKSLYEFGQKTGDEELMKQAAQMGQQVRFEPSSYDYKRSEAYHKFAKDRPVENPNTDAYGRPIYTPNEWEQEQNKKWGTAVGQGLKGGFLTLWETLQKASENNLKNRWDPAYQSRKYSAEYLQHKANKEQDEREKIRLNAKAAKARKEAAEYRHDEGIGTDTPGMQALRASSEATEDLVNNAKTGGGKLLTKAGISMLQMAPFLAANVIPGAGQAISLGGMGALAAGQKAGELQQDNRVSAQEAFARGLVSGGIEAFTEKIPMDSLLKLVKGGGGTNFIKAVAKQAGIEATEESASYTMNWLADKAARDPKAKFSLSDLAENAAIGAISGAAFGAGGHVIGSAIGAGRTPYNSPSPTDDTTPTPTVEEAPRPIQKQSTQESANPLIRASQVQEQKPTVKEQVAEKRWQRKRLLELNEQEQELNERFKSANKRAFSAKTDAEMQEAINEQNEITAERARISNEREELKARLSVPFHPDLQTRTQEAEPVQETTRSAKERLEAAQQAYRQRIQEQAQANQDTGAQIQSAKERLEAAQQAYRQQVQAQQEQLLQETENPTPVAQEQEQNGQAQNTGDLVQNQPERVKLTRADAERLLPYLDDMENNVRAMLKRNMEAMFEERNMENAVRLSNEQKNLLNNLQEIKEERKNLQAILDTEPEAQSHAQFEPQSQAQSQAQTQDTQVQQNTNEIPATFDEYKAQFQDVIDSGEMTEGQLLDEYNAIRRRNERLQRRGEPIRRTLSGNPSDTATPSSMDSVAQEQGAFNEENSLPEGMGAASKNFAGDFASWVENTPGYQFHRINESAYQQTEAEQGRAREEIPTMNPYGRLTSKTASTLMNANITPNDFVTKMEDALARGEFSRMVYSDAKATAQVRQKIENVGFQRAKEDWMGEMQNGISSKFNTAMGITLYNNAVNAGDAIAALDIANTMIDYAKDTAQALQGFNLINKMSPEGQLYSITKTVENLNEKARRRSKVDKETGLPKFEDIELDPELVQRFLDAETQEERDAIRKEIYQDIGRKMPATWQDKFDAIRYTMMLANLRTHDRNLAGNTGFMPVRMMKNVVAASMESAFKVNDRTKALINVGSKADRALLQAGWNDFLNVEDLIKNGGKYDEAQSIIRDNQQVFTSPVGKAFQKISDANSWLLDKEDMIFSRPAYAESLAMYLKANKISAVDYMNDTISQEAKNKAQEYAILEAQKATYRDLNAFSEFVTRLNRLKHSNNSVERAASYLVEGLLPFKKTPANILVRGVEYSPIGLAKGLTYDLAQVRNGNKTAAEAIDNIAAGLTGTGLLALGGLMFANGLVSAGSTGDDKQDDFNDLRGAQSYALQIGDKSYTLDWLAPEALPFFVGVELKNAYDQREGLNFFQFLDVLKNVADPMLEMSMLQSLNDTIDNIKFSDNGLGAIVSNVLTNYLTQFLPTLGGQIERTGESTRQSTFYDPNSPLPKSLQKLIGKTLNKVPGLEYNQIDYLDAWGRTEETGTPLQRFFNNFLSPGYSSTWNSSAMEDELQRLYDAGYTDVFPSSVKQSADFMGGKMTADQWSARQKTQGQEAYRILTQFMQTDTYKNMSDDDKARYIETVYDYANGIGKIAAGEPAEKEAKWIQSAQAGKEKVGLDPSTFASVYAYKRTLENDDSTDDEVVKQGMLEDYINGRSDLNDSQKEYLRDSIKFFKMNPVKADSYQKVKNAGYDNPQEIQALLNAKKEFDTNGNGDINNSELYKGIVGKTSDPVEQEKLYNAYKDKNVTTSWSDFAKTQGAQTAKEEKAQTALNNVVSTEKQASFASSVETNGKDSYVKIYRALMAVDATEAERAAYYDYINSQRGTPWKKDWAHAKQKAIENIAAGK